MVYLQENSLTEYLALVKPHVPEPLIDADHWADIEAIARWIPSPITNFFGFECRLGDPTPQADFLLAIGAKEAGQRILAGQSPRYPLYTDLLKVPVWQQVQQFTTTWLDEGSDLHGNVNNLWLEFDVDENADGNAAEPPMPSCFFGTQTILVNPDADKPNAEPSHQWVTQTAIPQLQGYPLEADLQQRLLICLDALPIGAHVFQVGLMLARRVNLVRLCLRNITPAQVLSYLQTLNWPGSTEARSPHLLKLSDLADRVDVDLDVSPQGICPKLGFECYLQAQPKHNPAWGKFLDYLVAEGWCLPQKRDALLSYPGFVRERDNPDRWPPHLRKLAQFLGDGKEGVFFRGLHHIKLVFHTDHMVEAKAYCWVSQQLLGKPATQPAVPQVIHREFPNFLPESVAQELLDFTLAQQANFAPSEVNPYSTPDDHRLNRLTRNSLLFAGDIPEAIKDQLLQPLKAILPEVFATLGLPPCEAAGFEVQLTAHNDGHYFRVHNDVIKAADQNVNRLLTFVYYLHRQPCPFKGGNLYIYPTTEVSEVSKCYPQFVTPTHNSLVLFPSHYFHEVAPVNCPSTAFVDSRFTLNGWVWQSLDVDKEISEKGK
jgi:Rps23 Pro-64 3,4-dihydroxylase Tpa1-like proline 4-hydroxylase